MSSETTLDNITKEQIACLLQTSIKEGNARVMILCHWASEGDNYARGECARIINEAAANS